MSLGVISLNTKVVRLEVRGERWKVVVRDGNEGTEGKEEVEESWDAVVVAIGWYDNPVWPRWMGCKS